MSLRLGVDLDGTLADLSGAYADTARRLFGGEAVTDAPPPESPDPADAPEAAAAPSDAERLRDARQSSARRSAIWRAMLDVPDFWTTLAPIEPGIIAQLSDLSRARGWEVFFVTQRPKSAGSPVQRQSQEWLAAQGFVAPSVLTLRGGRGMVARVLELDVLVDDLAKNCVDVVADSECRPLLVSRSPGCGDRRRRRAAEHPGGAVGGRGADDPDRAARAAAEPDGPRDEGVAARLRVIAGRRNVRGRRPPSW
jgi:hypothetical protein